MLSAMRPVWGRETILLSVDRSSGAGTSIIMQARPVRGATSLLLDVGHGRVSTYAIQTELTEAFHPFLPMLKGFRQGRQPLNEGCYNFIRAKFDDLVASADAKARVRCSRY